MGDTVVRGPDWLVHHSDQSNGGAGQKGTVEKDHQEKGAFYVKWDNGTTDAYRCGYDNLIEIVAVEVTEVRLCYPFLSLSLSLSLPPPPLSLFLSPPPSLCVSEWSDKALQSRFRPSTPLSNDAQTSFGWWPLYPPVVSLFEGYNTLNS